MKNKIEKDNRSGGIPVRPGMCLMKGMMDVGLVAKHTLLHEASPENGSLLFIDKAPYKFSSCMKTRFSCISVFSLQLEDTEAAAVSI